MSSDNGVRALLHYVCWTRLAAFICRTLVAVRVDTHMHIIVIALWISHTQNLGSHGDNEDVSSHSRASSLRLFPYIHVRPVREFPNEVSQ